MNQKKFFIAIGLLVLAVFSVACMRGLAADTSARTFATPQAAADALVAAAEKWDVPALEAILGPGSKDILHTSAEADDRETAKQFAERARMNMDVSIDPQSKRRAFISIGDDHWPFPVPIVKVAKGWAFDSKAGRNEVVFRRIGRNELDAIEICHGFVEAQDEYAMTKHDGSTVNQFAQKIISTPGKQDGLAWQDKDGNWQGPVGKEIADAIEKGYSPKAEPYHGYFFKVLKGQGPAAPLGAMDYVVNGAMIGGFALVAFPAQYRVTGVMTFMVSNDGVVYQKDLGQNTIQTVGQIERFNPDKTWTPVVEQ